MSAESQPCLWMRNRSADETLVQRDRIRSNVVIAAVVHEAAVLNKKRNQSVVRAVDHQLIIGGRHVRKGLDLSVSPGLQNPRCRFRSFRCSLRSFPPHHCSARSSISRRSLPPRPIRTKSSLPEALCLSIIPLPRPNRIRNPTQTAPKRLHSY